MYIRSDDAFYNEFYDDSYDYDDDEQKQEQESGLENHDLCNEFFNMVTDDPPSKAEKILKALDQKEFQLESLTLNHRFLADEYDNPILMSLYQRHCTNLRVLKIEAFRNEISNSLRCILLSEVF